MHILIDGYNLIRQSDTLRRMERQSLEAGRKALIEYLAFYKRKRGHKITVVFDGWDSGFAQEERDYLAGINILYSKRGEKADELIKRITAHSDEEIIVVSSDREILSFARRRGKTSLSSPEFELIINRTLKPSPETDDFGGNSYQKDDDNEQTSGRYFGKKKGAAHKLSRAQRQAKTKIKKL